MRRSPNHEHPSAPPLHGNGTVGLAQRKTMSPDHATVDRLPPHSPDAERCVLGSMLRDNRVIGDVLQILTSEDTFYADAHQKIFKSIRALYDRGNPVDAVILADALKEQKHIEDIGGYAYL